jgi:hypothetical protein
LRNRFLHVPGLVEFVDDASFGIVADDRTADLVDDVAGVFK